MEISFDKFRDWAEKRFGDISVKGDEIKINSIFTEDYKHKLWCNPKGGKNNIPGGVFHCWKTNQHGSLISLVMKVEKCTFSQAIEILGGNDITFEDLEKKVQELFDKKEELQAINPACDKLTLPPHTYLIDELPSYSKHRIEAEVHLLNRKIPIDGLMICVKGDYRDRIIIPYYDRFNNLIYFNGRLLHDKGSKYRGPEKEVGIGKGDVLYFPIWPEDGNEIFLTEGEFDALSIRQTGLYSAACGGKILSDIQIEMLKKYKLVLSLDGDKAGKQALIDIGDKLLGLGMEFSYIRPPKEHKDWNEILQKHNADILKSYILNNKKIFNATTSTKIKLT